MCLKTEKISSEMPFNEMLSYPGLLLSFRLANALSYSSSASSDP